MTAWLRSKYNVYCRPRLDRDLRHLRAAFALPFPYEECPPDVHLRNAVAWHEVTNRQLCGEGFSNKFSLGSDYGLGPSYPETTGYTLCTLLAMLRTRPVADFDYPAIEALTGRSYRYLLGLQLPCGSFPGGHERLRNYGQPSVFNTGQIVLGLADAYETHSRLPLEFVVPSRLEDVLARAGRFLAGEVEADGSYNVRHTYTKAKRSYYARATFGLMRIGQVLGDDAFTATARRNFDWVAGNQLPNGAILHWGFEEAWGVLHTIAYTLRGLIEAAQFYGEAAYEQCVLNVIDFLVRHTSDTFPYPGLIPSHFTYEGRHLDELCVTGLSQLAIVLAKIEAPRRTPAHDALFRGLVSATKRFQVRGLRDAFKNGAMPASYPLAGRYQPNSLIQWGTKFFMDTMLLELNVPADELKG